MTLTLTHVVRPSTPGEARPPLVLLLHGVGGNERQMAGLAQRFDARCVVVSVRSPFELGPDAYAWFHVAFTGSGPRLDAQELQAAIVALRRFRDEAVHAYAADPRRVYVAGFSQGGIMALAGLLTAPDAFAGAICMSGRLPAEVVQHADPEAAGRPVLLVHGERDPVLPLRLAHAARDELQRLGLAVEYQEFAMAREVTPASLAAATTWLARRLDA